MKRTICVYIVEDDVDDLMLLREALKNVIPEIQITELSNGKDLFELLDSQTPATMPDLILSDVNMPKVNGLDALSILKSNPATQHIPVILLSTSSDPTLIREAYDYGACAFLTKPVIFQQYQSLAESVSLCFLHNFASVETSTFSENFKNKSILFIEDSSDHCELIQMAFKRSLPNITLFNQQTKNGVLDFLTDVWNTLSNPPELIVLDLYLPTRRDGLNLLDSIHYFFKIHRLAPVPVIVFSASEDKNDIAASYQHSANAYVIKDMELIYSPSFFQNVCTFWWQTIEVPKKPSRPAGQIKRSS